MVTVAASNLTWLFGAFATDWLLLLFVLAVSQTLVEILLVQ